MGVLYLKKPLSTGNLFIKYLIHNTFDFKESASDDLELEAWLDLDSLVDSFDVLPFELLPQLLPFDFLSYSFSAYFRQFRTLCLKVNTLWSTSSNCSSSFDHSSGFKILQCSSWFCIISLKMLSYWASSSLTVMKFLLL